ncbi:hypothetical protein F9L16_12755 [Agarivorans sp. B2Z047]|uniref:P-loop NTPase fold protein n=1 Tax=Agarivorans sp. B2Z047 TaxID=2652721 RepID=UPI00128CDB65|nr:P-loop NTPase fold protein [Agarivorans sp. B2Z047]MPW29859.1 hypothetical protein [Agarivorans sp. B2Z047]UQN43427.1 KAP family NTPase [Agarivorans sp. B2Z047]
MTKCVTDQILDSIIDPSFPSMVLLSGEWGCGKTYLAKNTLRPKLESVEAYKSTNCLSLYGVTSLDDFRDKLISLRHLSGQDKGRNLSIFKNLAGNGAKWGGDNGASLAIGNALTKPFRHKLLSKMSNCAFIIDDLERCSSEQLISEVLGECLNLVENNANLAIIVIANEKQIENKSLLEKTFNDKFYLTSSAQSITSFLESKYSSFLDPSSIEQAVLTIQSLEMSNLRVIQRAMQRYVPIKERFKKITELDEPAASNQTLDSVLRICHAHYELGCNIEQIFESSNASNIDSEPWKDRPEEGELLRKTVRNTKFTTYLVSYCLNKISIPDDLVDGFALPVTTSPVDYISSMSIHHFSEKDFYHAIDETKQFLFGGNKKPFSKWFRVLDSYFYLVQHQFIDENFEEEYEQAKEAIETLGFFKHEDVVSDRNYSPMRGFDIKQTQTLYDNIKPHYERESAISSMDDLEKRFLIAWSESSKDIYGSYEHRPFLHQFDLEKVVNSIAKKWPLEDIGVFGQFLRSRYQALNSNEFVGEEFLFVRDLDAKLQSALSNMKPSRRRGMVSELTGYLRVAMQYIDRTQKDN